MTICGEPVRERCRADAGSRPAPWSSASAVQVPRRTTWARPARVTWRTSPRRVDADRRRGEKSAAGPAHARRYPSEPIVLIRPWPGESGRRPAAQVAGEMQPLWVIDDLRHTQQSSIRSAGPILGRGVETSSCMNRVGSRHSPRSPASRGIGRTSGSAARGADAVSNRGMRRSRNISAICALSSSAAASRSVTSSLSHDV